MIIENGTISYATETDGGTDELGRVIPTVTEWSEEHPCNIQANAVNLRAEYEDGSYKKAAYTVLLPIQPFPYHRARLTLMCEVLGEFKVASVEPLQAVGMVRVAVTT